MKELVCEEKKEIDFREIESIMNSQQAKRRRAEALRVKKERELTRLIVHDCVIAFATICIVVALSLIF